MTIDSKVDKEKRTLGSDVSHALRIAEKSSAYFGWRTRPLDCHRTSSMSIRGYERGGGELGVRRDQRSAFEIKSTLITFEIGELTAKSGQNPKRAFHRKPLRDTTERMKLRHAAALALVGWYLILPPIKPTHAPLSQWEIVLIYDTADMCEQNRNERIAAWKSTADLGTTPESRVFVQRILKGVCIADNDPRLKGNL